MNSKKLTLFISLIIMAVIAYLYFNMHGENDRISIRENYTFALEGELYFLRGPLSDTIAKIDLEIADSQDEISRGLMFRDSLPSNGGMLFIFPDPEERTFWMKNTRIPLDILFIGENSEIQYIIHHTTPYSTNPLPGFHLSKYVVEVNAGFCGKNGIKEGQFIQFKKQ